MSLTILKIIAFLAMLIDHVGIATENVYMRLIGRIAFPIFAYTIALGATKTKSRKKYVRNLFISALLSEIPYDLFMANMPIYSKAQNVMFTLLAGLLVICAIDKIKEKKITVLYLLPIIILLFIIPELINSNYGAIGVLLIVMLYLAKQNPIKIGVSVVMFSILEFITANNTSWGIILFFSIISIPFLIFHKSSKKPKHYKIFKICSYLFYPLHMLILALIF